MKEVIFNRRNELLRVPLAKAMFYEAYGNYCYGVFPNKQKVMLPIGLSQVGELLGKAAEQEQMSFIRIGKKFIVNADMIVQINFSKQQLILSDFDHPGNFALPVAKEALKQVKELYEQHQIWK
ncbi:MAG: LytTR family transcriptional regulator [Bacteroidaceae bacterium]|nr:LytTR family transcriptional regulator [Bacteroidaceae bacterium]